MSIYRCLFPVRYEHYVVLHDSVLSSVFATRLLATFAEVAYIFLLAYVLRFLNADNVGWIDGLAWLMALQVVVCQVCVWVAILAERFDFYFYEDTPGKINTAELTALKAVMFGRIGVDGLIGAAVNR